MSARQRQRRGSPPSRREAITLSVSFTLGWVVIFVMLLLPALRWLPLLALAGGLVGAPIAAPAITAAKGLRRDSNGSGESSSPPRSPQSPSSSTLPSFTEGEA